MSGALVLLVDGSSGDVFAAARTGADGSYDFSVAPSGQASAAPPASEEGDSQEVAPLPASSVQGSGAVRVYAAGYAALSVPAGAGDVTDVRLSGPHTYGRDFAQIL